MQSIGIVLEKKFKSMPQSMQNQEILPQINPFNSFSDLIGDAINSSQLKNPMELYELDYLGDIKELWNEL